MAPCLYRAGMRLLSHVSGSYQRNMQECLCGRPCVLTNFFEVVSLDCAVEIQKLLFCAPVPPAQAAFYRECAEEKPWAITAALLSKCPLLAEWFHCKQPWLLCSVPLHEESLQGISTESYSSSYAEVLHAASFSETRAHSRETAGNSPSVSHKSEPP